MVITPEDRNILQAQDISRAHLIEELCPQLGVPMVEKNIETYDIYTTDVAFMTDTPFCMLSVTTLRGNLILAGEVAEIFSKLIGCRSDDAGISIVVKIKKWDATCKNVDSSAAPTPCRFKSK